MKQITEDYCSFETAKLLKEKGFNERCGTAYTTTERYPIRVMGSTYSLERNSHYDNFHYSMPSQSLVLKWLREVHNIYIDILTYTTGKNIQFRWIGYDKGRLFSQEEGKTIYFDSYEEAVEATLLYVLKNLI